MNRITDYELSNLILRIEQDKTYTPKDSVVNLGALRDLVDARLTCEADANDEIVRLRSQLIARKAELIATEAELQLPENQRILEIRRLEIEVERLKTPEGKADYFFNWQEAKRDLKNTSRDYSELRESYDKLFDEHQRLKESLSQAVHGYHHVNCVKVVHVGRGHLHGPDDDSPYDVDGCKYCGRCHIAL